MAGLPDFAAVAGAVDANTRELTQAVDALVGAERATAFNQAWADHIDALVGYTVALGDGDDAALQVAVGRMEQVRGVLASAFSDLTGGLVPAAAASEVLTTHDGQLVSQADAYAVANYEEAHRLSNEGYHHMFATAATLASAITATMAQQMPVGTPRPGAAARWSTIRMANLRVAWLLRGITGFGCSGEPSAARATSDSGASSTTAPVTVPEAVRNFEAARDHQTVAVPVAVDVPSLGITDALETLHRRPDGTIDVPSWHVAGWWAEGPKPGQPGPAVILGHVDSRHGPDVFYRLDQVQPGHEIVVTRADRTTVRFTVDRVERVPKESFPTEKVFAPSLTAGLRLVTCGGEFDRAAGHYEDNVIVFASLSG